MLVRAPCTDEELRSNVRHALGLGLPEARDGVVLTRDPLYIVANGPSAAKAPRAGNTLATNGAIRLWPTPQGPTYWVGADPQALLADLIGDPPLNTAYLVASKCHPSVFERLQGRDVVVWHVADDATWPLLADRQPVAAWASVTISTFELMARLGWRSFEVWGWDGCVLDGKDHAAPQETAQEWVQVEVAGRRFTTSHTWLHEAQSGGQALAGFPFPVHVHGDGMVPAFLGSVLPRRVMTDHRS